jgi:hypothetical protein
MYGSGQPYLWGSTRPEGLKDDRQQKGTVTIFLVQAEGNAHTVTYDKCQDSSKRHSGTNRASWGLHMRQQLNMLRIKDDMCWRARGQQQFSRGTFIGVLWHTESAFHWIMAPEACWQSATATVVYLDGVLWHSWGQQLQLALCQTGQGRHYFPTGPDILYSTSALLCGPCDDMKGSKQITQAQVEHWFQLQGWAFRLSPLTCAPLSCRWRLEEDSYMSAQGVHKSTFISHLYQTVIRWNPTHIPIVIIPKG